MSEKKQLEFRELEAGYEFPPSQYQLDSMVVATYLKAVGDEDGLYQDEKLVPPLAIAAYAMTALSQNIRLPSGTIHVSQELEFKATVNVGENLTSQARVARKQSRGKLHLMDIDLSVSNQRKSVVLTGKTSFILPEQDAGR